MYSRTVIGIKPPSMRIVLYLTEWQFVRDHSFGILLFTALFTGFQIVFTTKTQGSQSIHTLAVWTHFMYPTVHSHVTLMMQSVQAIGAATTENKKWKYFSFRLWITEECQQVWSCVRKCLCTFFRWTET